MYLVQCEIAGKQGNNTLKQTNDNDWRPTTGGTGMHRVRYLKKDLTVHRLEAGLASEPHTPCKAPLGAPSARVRCTGRGSAFTVTANAVERCVCVCVRLKYEPRACQTDCS